MSQSNEKKKKTRFIILTLKQKP